MDKLFSLENALLFEKEAVSAYEKALARNLVAALRENERLLDDLEVIANWRVLDIAHAVVIASKALYRNKESGNE